MVIKPPYSEEIKNKSIFSIYTILISRLSMSFRKELSKATEMKKEFPRSSSRRR